MPNDPGHNLVAKLQIYDDKGKLIFTHSFYGTDQLGEFIKYGESFYIYSEHDIYNPILRALKAGSKKQKIRVMSVRQVGGEEGTLLIEQNYGFREPEEQDYKMEAVKLANKSVRWEADE